MHVAREFLACNMSSELLVLFSACSVFRFYFYFVWKLCILDGIRFVCFCFEMESPASASRVAGITGAHCHTWLVVVFFVEMEFHHVDQTGLKLLSSSNLPALATQSAGITGLSHCTWLHFSVYLKLL